MQRLASRRLVVAFTMCALSCGGSSSTNAPADAGEDAGFDAGVDAGPPMLPGAPLDVRADAGYGQVGVYWAPPTSDGNSPITGYMITAMPGGMTGTTKGELYYEFPNLTNGTAYTFTVTATNAVGTGPASDATMPVTPTGEPAAPTNVVATAGSQSATVTWQDDDEGLTLYGCTATAKPGGAQAGSGGESNTATVSGLTAGTSYTFTVACTNSIGTGPSSAPSNAVTPTP